MKKRQNGSWYWIMYTSRAPVIPPRKIQTARFSRCACLSLLACRAAPPARGKSRTRGRASSRSRKSASSNPATMTAASRMASRRCGRGLDTFGVQQIGRRRSADGHRINRCDVRGQSPSRNLNNSVQVHEVQLGGPWLLGITASIGSLEAVANESFNPEASGDGAACRRRWLRVNYHALAGRPVLFLSACRLLRNHRQQQVGWMFVIVKYDLVRRQVAGLGFVVAAGVEVAREHGE